MKKPAFKFTASSVTLLQPLSTMLGIIASKRTLPIIDNFLFALNGSTLTITATDLETTITTTLEVEAKKGEGMVTVPAKVLVKLLRNLPTQHITVFGNADHSIRIACEQGIYELSGDDPMGFPKTATMEKPSKFSLPASAMSRGLGRTLWAVGNDDLRPVMCGVFFELQDKHLHFVATDAHRLVQHTTTTDKRAAEASFIVRKRTCAIVRKLAAVASGKVTVEYTEHAVAFTIDNTVVRSRTIDGKYPNYRAVIPENSPNKLTVGRSLFINAMRRMSVFAHHITQQVILDADNLQVRLIAEDLDTINKANEKMASSYVGQHIRIAFRSSYIMEVLQHLSGDEVTLCMDRPNRAATVIETSEDGKETTLSLIMPVLIND